PAKRSSEARPMGGGAPASLEPATRVLGSAAMNRSREIVVVESSELAAIAAHRIAQLIRDLGQRRPTVSLALAGGGTPRAMHERLVLQTEMPWQKLSIFFGDERSVPPDSPDSNYRMARESLL